MTYYMTTREILMALHLDTHEQRTVACTALGDAGYQGLARALSDASADAGVQCVRIDDELLEELRALVARSCAGLTACRTRSSRAQ